MLLLNFRLASILLTDDRGEPGPTQDRTILEDLQSTSNLEQTRLQAHAAVLPTQLQTGITMLLSRFQNCKKREKKSL